MSGVAARSTTSSTEPTGVVGNKDDSGSLRAPQPRSEGNMTVVEGKSDGVALLVVEWQGAKSKQAARILADLIIRLLRPTIRRVAMRFGAPARGSLALEDLEQVAAIEAFQFFSKYDHAKMGSTTFEQHVYRRALKACVVYTELNGSDVRPSRHMQQAAKGQATGSYKGRIVETTCHVSSRDAATGDHGDSGDFDGARELDDGGSAYSLARPGAVQSDAVTNPEEMLEGAEVKQALFAALATLTPDRRDLVLDAFGIGRDSEASLRDIAARRNVPRSRLATDLDEALSDLHAKLQ